MITVENLVKRYGSTTAVDDLSFSLTPGRVTGFLGPNGSGEIHHNALHRRFGSPNKRALHNPRC